MRSLSFQLLPPCLLLPSVLPNRDVPLSLWNDMPNISFNKLHWSWCLITAAEKHPSQVLGYFHYIIFVYSVPVNMDMQLSIMST
ncbi:hypothetical protein LEMLEM_LOCUS7843 [Lemmus lemmus]